MTTSAAPFHVAPSGKIRGLDGLRGLAVITVVLTHMGMYAVWVRNGLLGNGALPMVDGDAGVHVFFVLSGFLITGLLVQEMEATGRVSVRRFYMRRILRIFPLYFLVVGLVAAMQLVGNSEVPRRTFLYALTYTFNFMPRADYAGVLGHLWSLAVEEHYYLVWPLVFGALFLHRRGWLLALAALVLALFLYLQGAGLNAFRAAYFVDYWTVTAGASILIGSLFGILASTRDLPAALTAALRSPAALLLAALLYAHTWWGGSLPWELGKPVRALGVGVLLCYLAAHQQSLIARVLELPPLRYLGVISYGVYLWQGFFLSTNPGRTATQTWPPRSQLTGLVLLALVAPLSYHGFEKPILRLKRRFAVRRASHAAPTDERIGAARVAFAGHRKECAAGSSD